MIKRHNLVTYLIFVLLLIIKIVFYFTYYSYVDATSYFTNKYYFNWLNELNNLNLSDNSFFSSLILTSAETISAVEPFSGFFYFILLNSGLNPILTYHTVNIIFILCLLYFVLNNSYSYCVLILSIFLFLFGYYEYVTIHLTHRLKVGLIIYFLIFRFNNINLRFLLLFSLPLFHFSLILAIPLYCLIENLSKNQKFIKYIVLYILSICILGFTLFYHVETLPTSIHNKLNYFLDFKYFKEITLFLIINFIIFNRFNYFKLYFIFGIIFISLIAYSSRTVHLLYFILLPLVFYNMNHFSKFYKIALNSIIYIFLIYNIYISFRLSPFLKLELYW